MTNHPQGSVTPSRMCSVEIEQEEKVLVIIMFYWHLFLKGTVRARAVVWTALVTKVPQIQPRKGKYHDF